MLENARKIAVPLVIMNRHINQSRCERYILSVEFDVCYKKRLSSATYLYITSQREILTKW